MAPWFKKKDTDMDDESSLVTLACGAGPDAAAAVAAAGAGDARSVGSSDACVECVFSAHAADAADAVTASANPSATTKSVPATYDPEHQLFTCRAPKDVASLPYEVRMGGKVVQSGCPGACPRFVVAGDNGAPSGGAACGPSDNSSPPTQPEHPSVLGRMSWLDRLLPLWIVLAMAAGILLGVFSPSARDAFGAGAVHIGEVSLPIALGLWLMMLPVLTKVRYELLGPLLFQRVVAKQLGVSLFLNWLVGPALMTGLAWLCLPDLPRYRSGVIMVGLARCIAMVLIWNDLSGGHPELCAVTVAVNSVLQIVLYAPLSMIYLGPEVVGGAGGGAQGFWLVCKSVLLFLGLPLVAALILRYAIIAASSRDFLERRVMKYFGPVALLALLYTIVALFAAQGDRIVAEIANICRVAVPMLIYFFLQFALGFAAAWFIHAPYSYAATQAFTAASNNFELGIAVAVGVWGAQSPEALAATVGPLVEVPVLVSLVYVSLWVRKKWYIKRDAELVATGKMPADIHEIVEAREKMRAEKRAAKKAAKEAAGRAGAAAPSSVEMRSNH
jgi:arsenite transporter